MFTYAQFLYYFTNFSSLSCFLPVIFSTLRRKDLNSYMKPLFLLSIVAIVTEITNAVHAFFVVNNYYIFHLYTIVEFSLICLFYHRFLKQYFRDLVTIPIILIFLISAYIDFKINGLAKFDNFSISFEAIILSCYALFSFYYILKHLLFENLLNAPVFWVNAGIIIYFSGNLILFVFTNILFRDYSEKYTIVWNSIHSITNLVYNILMSIAFWKTRVK